MLKPFTFAALLSAAFSLSACMGGGTATDFVTATAGMRGAINATEPPSEVDYQLSCAEVETRIANLRARYEAIEAEQRAAQRRQGLINGGIEALASVAGASAIANAGSAQAISNAATATNLGRGALMGLANQESSADQLATINDATLIATRMSQLQRVAFENGC